MNNGGEVWHCKSIQVAVRVVLTIAVIPVSGPVTSALLVSDAGYHRTDRAQQNRAQQNRAQLQWINTVPVSPPLTTVPTVDKSSDHRHTVLSTNIASVFWLVSD